MFHRQLKNPFILLLLPVILTTAQTFSLGCGGDTDGGGTLKYYTTCGDPVCSSHRATGVPACTTQTAGAGCATSGEQCDPGNLCNSLIVCARTDPKSGSGGCPISRKSSKSDIHYLGQPDLLHYHDELRKVPLATFRYKDGGPAAPTHLGFMIDDVEPSMSVDPERNMVDLYGYTTMAVAAVQIQAQQIEALQKEVAGLRQQLQETRHKGTPLTRGPRPATR